MLSGAFLSRVSPSGVEAAFSREAAITACL